MRRRYGNFEVVVGAGAYEDPCRTTACSGQWRARGEGARSKLRQPSNEPALNLFDEIGSPTTPVTASPVSQNGRILLANSAESNIAPRVWLL
jgi:hypothetical protein